jgi:5'(3')-deoxyribonucleotidase
MKIDPTTLAFDIDGVVADTMGLFIDIARAEHGVDHVRYEDITTYILQNCLDLGDDIIGDIIAKLLDGSHDQGLAAIEGASEIIQRLAGHKNPVLFVTARPSGDSIRQWMYDALALESSQVEVIATGAFEAKADILAEKGITHFVEDRLETCFQLEDTGITPILFKQPWNREAHPFTEVASWYELAELIAF